MEMRAKNKKTKTLKSALKRSVVLFPALLLAGAFTTQTDLTPKRQTELLYILEQDCGSCHGLTMKGGLGPALVTERMDPWSLEQLTTVILDGVPGTPMPPWRPLLNEQEALFIAEALKSGEMVK